jgi:predicted nucleic acid-binding protein
MSGERFTFDTNILIYALDLSAGPKRAAAADLMMSAIGRDCVLVLQTLAEFYHAVTRKGIVPALEARRLVDDWGALFPVVSAEADDLRRAMQAQHKSKASFWDALLLATAERAGCRRLYSEDMQHGMKFGHLQVINPFRG